MQSNTPDAEEYFREDLTTIAFILRSFTIATATQTHERFRIPSRLEDGLLLKIHMAQ